MKPFNLEEALAGKPVITRNGVKVEELVFFNYKELSEPILVKLEFRKVVLNFYRNGSYLEDGIHENDLFMAEPERWVNIYYSKAQDDVLASDFYESEEEAKKCIVSTSTYQTTIKINP